MSCDYQTLPERLELDNAEEQLRDAVFVGRSNVGKSSLVNAVLGIEAAKTSKTPGKTRDLTYYPMERPYSRLIDCPGYGFARASRQERERWRKLMEMYFAESGTIQRVVFLVDMRAGLQDSDAMLMDMLVENSLLFSLVLTKVDKVKSSHVRDQANSVIDEVKQKGFMGVCSPLVFLTSAYTSYGLPELKSGLVHALEQPKLLRTVPGGGQQRTR